MGGRKAVAVAIGLDVEEEGLFSGRYAAAEPAIENIRYLERLAPIFDRGARISLFCAHCAFVQKPAWKMLDKMRGNYPVEIGAHLHHWNTPCKGHDPHKVLFRPWSALLSRDGIKARIETLLEAAEDYNGGRVSLFRMGRWDFHGDYWPLLKDAGIRYDASIRPLHCFAWPQGPDHYLAPPDPYIVRIDGWEIREIPCTVTPISRHLAKLGLVRNSLRKWGVLALLPVEHPLWLMKLATLSHLARGGKTLSLAWHSSEMMPGGNPRLPDVQAVEKFMGKISSYMDWLAKEFEIEYLTISEMGQKYARECVAGQGDWSWNPARGQIHA